MLRAGLQNPEHIYAGLTGDPEGLLSAEEASELQLQPPLPLHEQVLIKTCQPQTMSSSRCVPAASMSVCHNRPCLQQSSCGCKCSMCLLPRWRPIICCWLPQVTLYKYIVNVEGNCAALRLKQLLAGPSAVFFVQSDEIEWFYPLLKPFVHYIPVSFSWAGETQCFAGLLLLLFFEMSLLAPGVQHACPCNF